MTAADIRHKGEAMGERYLRAMSRALWDTDLVGCRMMLAIAEILWGLMLLWPGDTFGRPTYANMANVMGENAWAIMFMLSGITQGTIVLLEDFSSRFARYFAAWNSVLWMFVVTAMLTAVYPPPAAIGGEIALMLVAVWIWIRPFILAEGIQNARKQRH